jgi:hypothetical protein
MAKPSKIAQYLAAGDVLREAVNAYRATRDEALLQSAAGAADCNKRTKRKSYPLPPLDRPSEIPGFPLNAAGHDMPNYGSISWAPAPSTRAAMAERRGKNAPLKPTGPSGLRKKGRQ